MEDSRKTITIKMIDDHIGIFECVAMRMEERGRIKVKALLSSLELGRASLEEEVPDVVLLDVNFPQGNGMDFCRDMIARYPNLKIIMFTNHSGYNVYMVTMKYGARGFLLKSCMFEEILLAIETVHEGKIYICKEMQEVESRWNKRNEIIAMITPREQEILEYLTAGLTTKQIAIIIDRSEENVNSFRDKLFIKFNANNIAVLTAKAMSAGFLNLNRSHVLNEVKGFVVYAIEKYCETKKTRSVKEAFQFLDVNGFFHYITEKGRCEALNVNGTEYLESCFDRFLKSRNISVFPQ